MNVTAGRQIPGLCVDRVLVVALCSGCIQPTTYNLLGPAQRQQKRYTGQRQPSTGCHLGCLHSVKSRFSSPGDPRTLRGTSNGRDISGREQWCMESGYCGTSIGKPAVTSRLYTDNASGMGLVF